MNCLVVGFGSIGSRHASILKDMGHAVSVVTRRSLKEYLCFRSIEDALNHLVIDYAVIANETNCHMGSFLELNRMGFDGKMLIEKPVFWKCDKIPKFREKDVFVGYNLRFHPVIKRLYEAIMGETVCAAQVYVGQHLPFWRPGTDYTRCYSAMRSRGGGVLNDLSHELDYVNWIMGDWIRVAAIGGKFSSLEIDSDDVFGLLLECSRCPMVTIQMNYLDRTARREIIVHLKHTTIKADLIRGRIEVGDEVTDFKVDRNYTYTLQHESIVRGPDGTACTLDQGIQVMNLINAAETASDNKEWIYAFGKEK